MNRTRDFSFAAKLGSVAGMVMFGVLMLGSQPGSATPAPPVGPTDIQPPIATPYPPLPPKPKPCEVIKCVPPTLEPCLVKPGTTCTPPTTTKPPTLTPRPTKPPRPTTPTPPTTPTDPPTGSIPTPNRIDTGGGPSGGDAPTWLFWVVPGLGVLTLAAGASGWWIARSEQREH